MTTEMDSLELQVKTNAQQAASSLDALTQSLSKVKAATKGGAGLAAVEKQLSKINNALAGLDATKIAGAKTALSSLEDVKIKATATNAKLAESNVKVSKSFSAIKMAGVLYMYQRIVRTVSNWIKESNDYVENLNLFTVAMGEYAESAQEYAEKVNSLMGIDPSDWMRTQGVFQTLATGFGIASDKAAIMSQNLTQLSYDLASFYNLSVEDAAQKVQSAFSGELEPVRRLGFDLSQARLEAIATANGIDKAVSSMTQAEKSQLRYYALMTQVTQVHGDMARTLESPANQLRVFQAAVTQAGRALGNVFIPMLNAILPVATAALQVVRELADGLAAVFGFQLTTVDYSGVEAGSGAISDSLDEVADSAGGAKKALDNYALSIDELNTISPNKGGGGGGGASGNLSSMFEEIPTYNFLSQLEDKASELKDRLKEILETLLLLGGAAALFSLATQLSQAQGIWAALGKLLLTAIVIPLEFELAKNSLKEFITDKDIWDLIQGAFVIGAGSTILYKLWGDKGAVIGLGVGIVASVAAIHAAIMDGADYNSLEVEILQVLTAILGGLAGWKATGSVEGAVIGFGLATALALTVTNVSAIQSGQIKIDSEESIKSIIESTLLAGIVGAKLIGGPTGFVIGLGVGLVVNIVSALLADQSRKNAEEIAKRFGDIEISIEQMEEAAVRFVGSGLNQTMEEFTASKDKVAALKDEVIELFNTLDEKIELGVEPISKEEFESVVSTIDAYAAERKVMLQLAVDTLNLGTEMEQLLTGEGSTATKLSELGAQLKQVVSEGFNSDGEWIPDKYAKAMEIYGEMQEITNMVSELEFEVNMEMAIGEFELKDLTPESIKGFLETATKTIEERVGVLKEAEAAARIELKAQLEMGEIDKSEYEARLESLEASFREQKYTMYTNMYVEVSEFILESHGDLLNKMEEAMNSSEMQQGMKTASEAFYASYNKYFTGSEAEGWAKIGAENIVNYSKDALVNAMSSGLSEEEKASVQTLFDSIKPSYEKTMELAQEYYNAGLQIPEELGNALNSESAVAALAGDVDGMLYNLGANLTSSPSMINLLTMVEGAGEKLPDSLVLGINNNMPLVDAAVMEGIIPVTETLISNFEAAGIKVPSAWLEKLNEGISESSDGMISAGNAMSENVVNGAQSTLATSDYSGSIVDGMNNSVSNSSSGLQSAGSTAGSLFGGSLMSTVNSYVSQAQIAAQNAANVVSKVLSSAFDIDLDIKVPGYASGGYPTTGQLFIAREAGPEMVGTVGGRTAVANNDQIVEAVSAGVYQAVMSAQGNNEGGGMQIAVYLDGKQIEASVRSTQQKRGAVIATGGILNYA